MTEKSNASTESPKRRSSNRGGARQGAGRPSLADETVRQVKIYLTPSQHRKLAKLGGSKWVREAIDKS